MTDAPTDAPPNLRWCRTCDCCEHWRQRGGGCAKYPTQPVYRRQTCDDWEAAGFFRDAKVEAHE